MGGCAADALWLCCPSAHVEWMRLAGSPVGHHPELGGGIIKLRLIPHYDGGVDRDNVGMIQRIRARHRQPCAALNQSKSRWL